MLNDVYSEEVVNIGNNCFNHNDFSNSNFNLIHPSIFYSFYLNETFPNISFSFILHFYFSFNVKNFNLFSKIKFIFSSFLTFLTFLTILTFTNFSNDFNADNNDFKKLVNYAEIRKQNLFLIKGTDRFPDRVKNTPLCFFIKTKIHCKYLIFPQHQNLDLRDILDNFSKSVSFGLASFLKSNVSISEKHKINDLINLSLSFNQYISNNTFTTQWHQKIFQKEPNDSNITYVSINISFNDFYFLLFLIFILS